MRRAWLKFMVLAAMLLGLPMLGIKLAGYPIERYLEFPPKTCYVSPAPFAWIAFDVYTLFIVAAILPFVLRIIRTVSESETGPVAVRSFPWWGRLGIIWGAVFWVLAWTRFNWFAPWQQYTFTPLWLGLIVTVNALCYRRSGHCMLLDRTGYFLSLFPTSAAFWWFFEYLNRFVQNWHYTGVHAETLKYFLHATISFSTVLSAVLGTQEWIAHMTWVEQGFKNFMPLQISHPRRTAWTVFGVSGAGLVGIGVRPDYLFALLWISPLLIIVSLQALMGERHVLSDIADGDWRRVVSAAAAALFCGFFWEMWNYWSLAKWQYSVPFVDRFHIFEMPLLGYAGYLPFGLECLVIGTLLKRKNPLCRQA